jgi:hypothetical protein
MMVDTHCWDLAEHFLPAAASEEQKRELAEHIQYQVELWLEGKGIE